MFGGWMLFQHSMQYYVYVSTFELNGCLQHRVHHSQCLSQAFISSQSVALLSVHVPTNFTQETIPNECTKANTSDKWQL